MENQQTSPGDNDDNRAFETIIDEVTELSERENPVSVSEITDALGRASGVSIMLMAGALAATPLSGIPGLSSFCGIVIALSGAQLLIGRRTIWLPGFVLNRSVKAEKLRESVQKLRKVAQFLDRHTHERFHYFVRNVGRKTLEAVCMCLGSVMPFLELIPFSGSIAGGTVALFSIALLTRDGLWGAVGLTFLVGGATLATVLVR